MDDFGGHRAKQHPRHGTQAARAHDDLVAFLVADVTRNHFRGLFADADMDQAVDALVGAGYGSAGERCMAISVAVPVGKKTADILVEKLIPRVENLKIGPSSDDKADYGPMVTRQLLDKVRGYIDTGVKEGAKLVVDGRGRKVEGREKGFFLGGSLFDRVTPEMRIYQEEIFGPVLSVTTFEDEADALEIANDTLYGLGSGVWTRDINTAYRMGRGIQAGRVWTNCYHLYPAHAAFGGYKKSGIGRETHKMMLDHYQQTKNLLVSYSPKKLGFF